MSRKEAKALAADLRDLFRTSGSGLTVELRSGHWHVLTENGNSLASFGATPSDHRFRANTVSQLRRRGIVPRDFR